MFGDVELGHPGQRLELDADYRVHVRFTHSLGGDGHGHLTGRLCALGSKGSYDVVEEGQAGERILGAGWIEVLHTGIVGSRRADPARLVVGSSGGHRPRGAHDEGGGDRIHRGSRPTGLRAPRRGRP